MSESSNEVFVFPTTLARYEEPLPDSLRGLFSFYLQLETDMNKCSEQSDSIEAERVIGHLIILQTRVLKKAAATKAQSLDDLFYKLCFWRWESPELDDFDGETKGYQSIVRSAFRDLAGMVGQGGDCCKTVYADSLKISAAKTGRKAN